MDPKFVVQLQGRDYALYAGILGEAHERGLQAIETELIQIPSEANEHTAIVKATVRMKDGSVFQDYGDANPRNTNARIATALIRMASTRGKGRALRDAINVGQTMLEELPDLDEPETGRPAQAFYQPAAAPRSVVAESTPRGSAAESTPRAAVAESAAPIQAARSSANGEEPLICGNPACGKKITRGQHDLSMRTYGQPYCPSCQKLHAKSA
jgi:hypothetical protein